MIRQAHTYLVGAMGGATLIAIAIAVLRRARFGPGLQRLADRRRSAASDEAAVSEAQPGSMPAPGPAAQLRRLRPRRPTAAAATARQRGGRPRRRLAGRQRRRSTAPAAAPATAGRAAIGGGEPARAARRQRARRSRRRRRSGLRRSGNASGARRRLRRQRRLRRRRLRAAAAVAAAPPPRPPGTVTDTVNDTVTQVDETATRRGARSETGVTGVTEDVVNGVVGPESTVGKVVDETVGAVGGLLGGKR